MGDRRQDETWDHKDKERPGRVAYALVLPSGRASEDDASDPSGRAVDGPLVLTAQAG